MGIERLSARFDSGNLFKASTATLGHFLDENDSGALKPWGSHRASDFITVKTNTVYEIRSFESNFSNLRVMWYDADKTFIKGQIIARSGDYATFNSENASYVRISSGWTRTDNNIWQMQVAGLASNAMANLDTLRQTLTDADTALSRQITAMDTAYKSADRQLTANLASETTARTSADTALGQRITAIDTAYKSADSQTTAKLGQLEQSISDKDRAMASRVDTLTANYTALDNRTKWIELTAVTDLNTLTETGKYFIRAGSNPNAPFAQWTYVVVEKARNNRITQTAWADNNASLVYTRVYNGAWQAWEKTATGKELDTKASVASLNEFKQTSANADMALSERITAIDTAYKSADTATNAKLTQAEKAISDNNTALSQRMSALDTAYKKSDTDITARLAREETARAVAIVPTPKP